jgi:hypothetical protein
LTQVWKPPDVSKPDTVAQEGHEELDWIFPLLSLLNKVGFWIWSCGNLINLSEKS